MPVKKKSRNKEKGCKGVKLSSKVIVLKQGAIGMRFNSFGKDGCGY